jgi:hypothetical protein
LLKTMAWVSVGAGISLTAWHQVAPLLPSSSVLSPSVLATPSPAPTAMLGPSLRAVSATDALAALPAPVVYSDPTSNAPLAAAPAVNALRASNGSRVAANDAPHVAPTVGAAANAAAANFGSSKTSGASSLPNSITWPGNDNPASPPSKEEARGLMPPTPPSPPAAAAALPAAGALSAGGSAASSSAARGQSIAAETEHLREVQRAIRDGDAARALQLLDQDDAQFARGVLAQERSAARVQALCKQGRSESARAEAAHFEARWPRSALLGRIRAECH